MAFKFPQKLVRKDSRKLTRRLSDQSSPERDWTAGSGKRMVVAERLRRTRLDSEAWTWEESVHLDSEERDCVEIGRFLRMAADDFEESAIAVTRTDGASADFCSRYAAYALLGLLGTAAITWWFHKTVNR